MVSSSPCLPVGFSAGSRYSATSMQRFTRGDRESRVHNLTISNRGACSMPRSLMMSDDHVSDDDRVPSAVIR